jgi:hypothetical protein
MFFTAIDKYSQLNAARAAKVDQLIECSADGAPGVKDVINQNDVAILDIAGKVCASDNRLCAYGRKVIAIESYIKDTDWRPITFEVGDLRRHSLGERNTATLDSHEKEIAGAMVFFDNFRGKTSERAIDARAIHDASFLDEIHVRGY